MKKNNILKFFEYLVYFVVLLFALLSISSKFSIGGFKLLVVKSGSMEPKIKTGSVVVDKNASEYLIGDIITFKNKGNPQETTTHRVADKHQQNSIWLFSTKGDANDNVDSEQIPQDRIAGKVMLSIPYLGYVTSFARTLPGLMILIVIPATIIIYEEIRKIYREAGNMIKRRKEKHNTKVPEPGKKDENKPLNS